MKKEFLAILIGIVALTVISSSYASNGLEITVPKYEPYPVEPGEYFDLWVKVQNVGSETINSAEITILPSYPFSIDKTDVSTRTTSSIRSGQEELFKFRVRVDSKAVEGNNKIKIQNQIEGYSPITEDFDVLVQTRDAILSVVSIERSPKSFVPGQISTLNIVFENMADSVLTDISVNLGLTNGSIPFTTMNTTSERRIYVLDSEEQARVSFDILTLPNAKSQVYKVPVEITYYDNVGTKYTKDEVLGIVVGGTPVIDVLLDETTIKSSGTAGTVTIELVNRGFTDIKFLTIDVLNSDDFEIISQPKIYVGDIDSDDTDGVDINLFVKSTSNDNIQIPLNMHYFDSNNKEYDVAKSVQLNLYSKSELSKYGIDGGGSNLGLVIGLIVLAGLGWFVYNRWFKKR